MLKERRLERICGRPRRGLVAVVVAACVSLFGVETRAAPTPRESARIKVAEGAQLLTEGRYVDALASFEEAQTIFPSPKIHYNVGLAYRGLGKNALAFSAFDRFLREATDATADHAGQARAELERLSKLVALVSIACDVDGADMFLDGAAIGATPIMHRLPVEAGLHDLVIRSRDFGSRSHTFNVVRGETLQVKFEFRPPAAMRTFSPPPLPSIAPTPEADPPRTARPEASTVLPIARWSAAGIGAAALGAGIYFNLHSTSRRDEFGRIGCAETAGGTFTGPANCRSLASDFESAKRNAVIGYVAGGALAATAILLFLIPGEAGTDPAADRAVRPGTESSLLGATYTRRF